jgi:CheY-like chemotaxis protein
MTLNLPNHSETPLEVMNTTPQDTPPAVQAVNPAARGRILLVDDEPVLRAMASTVLIAQGWEVLNASSAEEAAELLKYCVWNHSMVDLVILDLILPGGMSGMEAIDALRKIQPGLRFVASSSFFAGEESRQNCLSLGFDEVLPKPYTASPLAELAERHIRPAVTSAAKPNQHSVLQAA